MFLLRKPLGTQRFQGRFSLFLHVAHCDMNDCSPDQFTFHFSSDSASRSPSRANRRSQVDRRSLIHCSTTESPSGSMRQVRTLPTFLVCTSPLSSSTCKC